jgi:hypothetical protein
MKSGDLIHMPGETVPEGEVPSIGIVIDTEPRHLHDKRVGVLWVGANGVDWEPKDWLEVLSEVVPVEA